MNRSPASLRRPPRYPAPAIVQTLRFLRDPFTLLDDALAECGEIFSLRLLGLGEWVFLCSPELVREMFKAPPGTLTAGEINRDLLGFLLGNDATFTLDGDAHRRRQKLVHPHLNGRRVLRHVPAMREIALEALRSWPAGRPFPVLDRAHRISLDVMFRAIFGATEPAKLTALTDLFETFARKGPRSPAVAMPYLQVDLGPWSPWGRILRLRTALRRAIAGEVEERLARSGEDPDAAPDVASALAWTAQPDGSRLSVDALTDEVVNLLFAGHETTGNALTWALETIHSHPEAEERLRAELDERLGGAPVEAAHLPELGYLRAVVQETFRHRPLAPMAGVRKVKEPFEIGGHVLAEGMLVTQCFPALAKRPELYRCPHRFDPEHFYERKTRPFEWNPFGGGTRMCVGRGLAEVELAVVLATLLQHGRFRLAQKTVRPVRSGLFFSPNRGLRLTVEERRPTRDAA